MIIEHILQANNSSTFFRCKNFGGKQKRLKCVLFITELTYTLLWKYVLYLIEINESCFVFEDKCFCWERRSHVPVCDPLLASDLEQVLTKR